MNAPSYVEFYTRGDNFDFFIDGIKVYPFSTAPATLPNWKEWIFTVNAGKHSFRWETTGQVVYLDSLRRASNFYNAFCEFTYCNNFRCYKYYSFIGYLWRQCNA